MKHTGKILLCAATALSLFLSLSPVASAEYAGNHLTGHIVKETGSADASADTSNLVKIHDTVFKITDAANEWNNGKGWRNDTENNYIVFVDYDGSDTSLITSDMDVTLAMSGMNRIKTISAGGNVNIIGTGIFLIDSIEMAAGAKLNVQPNTDLYTKGSAAVFLKQSDGTYRMLNGSDAEGILDEEYTLPENVHLTVPSNNVLDLSVLIIKTEEYTDESGNTVTDVKYYVNTEKGATEEPEHGGRVELTGTAGQLNIPASSSLTVEEGGTVSLHKSFYNYGYLASKLTVNGTVTVNGAVDGGTVDLNSGVIKGSGTVSNAHTYLSVYPETSDQITYSNNFLYLNSVSSGRTVNPVLDNTVMIVKCTDAALGNITVSGTTDIGYESNTSAGNISIASGGTLKLHSMYSMTAENPVMKLNGAVQGGTLLFCSGRYDTGSGFSTDSYSGNTSESYLFDAVIFDGSGTLPASDFPGVFTVQRAQAALEAAADTVPAVYAKALQGIEMTGMTGIHIEDGSIGTHETGVARGENNSTTLNELVLMTIGECQGNTYACVQAFKVDPEGNLSMSEYDTLDGNVTIDLENVFLLRVFNNKDVRNSEGGGASTSTNTSYTGTGILGGNTGSVSGGTETTVYTGTGRSEPDFGIKDDDDEKEDDKDDDNKDDDSKTDDTESSDNTVQEETAAVVTEYTEPAQNTEQAQTAAVVPQQPAAGITTAYVTAGRNSEYTLTAYRGGMQLTGLNGTSVTAEVRFPEGITDSCVCYAVFGDKWIPAVYDNDRNVLTFESDTLGPFKIARVLVEEVKYPEANTDAPIYRKLSVFVGNEELKEIPGTVSAESAVTAGEKTGRYLYAVFVDESEELTVIPASYDENSRKYLFDTDMTGNFVIVGLDEVPASDDALYEACRTSEEVRLLITLMRLNAFWS